MIADSETYRRLLQLHELRAKIDREIKALESGVRKLATPRQRRSREIVHGTNAGYQWHLRHQLPFDADDDCGCRDAHAAYVALGNRRRTARNKEVSP